ncbi:hypothetical protein TSAR_014793 [Trichomalopsis sarcophagae]|uniref:Uncharacterized protein n=1 Tax=Trichomalopsis sarcophagae TaxID=543379 RepID=A0A232EM40_9HYME|nr:hypothetical protein TSAR_014793 [Trichomalopsis sarcophagae]
MIAFYALVLAVCSVALPSASAAKQPFRDNIQDLHDALIAELVAEYQKSAGQIQLPDIGQAKQGTLGDLRLLQKPSDGLTLPGRADDPDKNPRMAMFRFGVPRAHAVFKNYKPMSIPFLRKRTIDYEIEDLDFFVEYTITVEHNECRLNLLKVRVHGKQGKVTVGGGLFKPTNPILEGFVENANTRIIEAAREDVESKVRDLLDNRQFECSFYEPSKQFLTA